MIPTSKRSDVFSTIRLAGPVVPIVVTGFRAETGALQTSLHVPAEFSPKPHLPQSLPKLSTVMSLLSMARFIFVAAAPCTVVPARKAKHTTTLRRRRIKAMSATCEFSRPSAIAMSLLRLTIGLSGPDYKWRFWPLQILRRLDQWGPETWRGPIRSVPFVAPTLAKWQGARRATYRSLPPLDAARFALMNVCWNADTEI